MENWLAEQTKAMVGEWEGAVDRFYPQHSAVWKDPAAQFKALTEEWNTLEAASWLEWKPFLNGTGLTVLDMGAGTGWLSAFLSRFSEVGSIDALDSSRRNLEVLLPGIVRLMNGDPAKIRPVLGLFTPVLAGNGHYDLIAASSALHHAPNLPAVLRETHRLLKDQGSLVILNETPLTRPRYFYQAARVFLSVAADVVRNKFREHAPSLSSNGILYDPYLGDVWHSRTYWEQAIRAAGFRVERRETPFFSYKNKASGPKLTHFICRKMDAQ